MNVIVIEPYTSHYPNPIKFAKGDILELGEMDTEYPGWILAISKDGRKGWAPVQYFDRENDSPTGVANMDYNAFELSTTMGQKLKVIRELNEWYLLETSEGQLGWVPTKTVNFGAKK